MKDSSVTMKISYCWDFWWIHDIVLEKFHSLYAFDLLVFKKEKLISHFSRIVGWLEL